MKTIYLASAAALAFSASGALADGHVSHVFPVGEGAFNWDSYNAYADAFDLSGQELTITGPWTGADAELVNSVIDYFESATGATVQYSGSDNFEQDIVIATQAGSAPNIAVFPQPGLMTDLASRGALTPLAPETADWVRDNYAAGDSWVSLGTAAGPEGEEALYGFFYKVDLKSLVWYSPEAFEEAGYDVPETMEELLALNDQIVADGETPWCIGLGSGGATGWPATDWVEDLMLRTQSPEVYDAWVSNEMPFDAPEVVNAIETFGTFARNEDYVNGGVEAVASTDFRESPLGLFSFPPECYMHRQASFIPTFFPEDAEADFFYFPAYEGEDLGSPVLGAGTLFGITDDSEAAQAFMAFLQTEISHEVWMAQSGFLTPHQGVNAELFGSDTLRQMNEILLDATTFRFDASDLMPSEIGQGIFWSGMVDYVGGEDAASVAGRIQDRWSEIQ
ncbi:ABC transporter substrate-binding protein [Gymnodinialimonas ceratoperidinii]|uniref:ABC transporter substrate-binding protein n=1 Tax=Gymnodinialimonas ceratoperidinii TaxID=2856823 RepID=A0A8F6TVV4_9RHOB|nr:ABC transporter substrate-binding protein [Gymnodinialimonas ceratoperidinii]QXT38641.1 ABC transporter substrate-binding protein [Gymnodinialimonas ceratoperidinii]